MKLSRRSLRGRMEIIMAEKNRKRIKDLVLIAFFAALIAVCSWISVPMPHGVPVTLQTFAIFAAAGILGIKRSAFAVGVYIIMGAIGVPVFSGFEGGLGRLLGVTGGYIIGFLFSVILTGIITKKAGKSFPALVISMCAGLLVCYAFGAAWFMYVYTASKGATTLGAILSVSVLPFIIPDIAKILLAASVVKAIDKTKIIPE